VFSLKSKEEGQSLWAFFCSWRKCFN